MSIHQLNAVTSFLITGGFVCFALLLWALSKAGLMNQTVRRISFAVWLLGSWFVIYLGTAFLREGWRLMQLETIFTYQHVPWVQQIAAYRFRDFFTLFRMGDEQYGYAIATSLVIWPLLTWLLRWRKPPPFSALVVLTVFSSVLVYFSAARGLGESIVLPIVYCVSLGLLGFQFYYLLFSAKSNHPIDVTLGGLAES